jgi:hypothetical protein
MKITGGEKKVETLLIDKPVLEEWHITRKT